MGAVKRLQTAETKVNGMVTKKNNLEGQKEATLKGLEEDYGVTTLLAANKLLTKKKKTLADTAEGIDDQIELVEGLIEAIEGDG